MHVMSDFAAIGLLLGLGMLATLTYGFLDKTVQDISEGVITGVRRGVPIPVSDRRLIFYRYWVVWSAGLFTYQAIIFAGWMFMATNARAADVRTMAYLCTFFGAVGVLSAAYQGILGYVHLASVLRKAATD
jgi:hypothetical protein